MTLEPMTRGEALEYAPQWGSYMRAGDPGAYMYSEFPDARHAREALAYIESDCLPIARRGDCCGTAGPCESDVRELERLALYLEPIAGRRWRVTYDVTTEESAMVGDFAESGFLDRHGGRVPARIGEPTPLVSMTLREACELVASGACEDSGAWITEADSRIDYATGAEERRALHPPRRISGASYGRLCALMGAS